MSKPFDSVEDSSATFCVLLIFTIKLTLALGGCRSALSPDDARVRTVRPPKCSHVTEAESRLMFIRSLHQQAAHAFCGRTATALPYLRNHERMCNDHVPWADARFVRTHDGPRRRIHRRRSMSVSQSYRNGSAPTALLIHGPFVDGSSCSGVIAELQAMRIEAIAPANPLRGLASDSAYIASVVAQFDGPVLLVGHSYGGAVIGVAGAE